MPAPTPAPPRSDRRSWRVPTPRPGAVAGRDRLGYWVAIAGPLGLVPWVPATWASLATAAAWWAAAPRPRAGFGWAPLALAAVLLPVGAWAAAAAERVENIADPRNVVLDEVAGQSLTFLFVAPADWRLALAGFVLFRLCDVLKPPPIRRLERAPAGWGVMLDDLLAGAYAALALALLARWL